MTTLRILHTESSPSLGGQELRILLEMERLAGRGCKSVLVARPDTPIVHEARRRHLTVHEVPMRMNLDPAAMWQLGRIMKRHRINILNAHNSKDAWTAMPVARLLGIPTVRARHIANPVRTNRTSQLVYGPLCDAVMTTSESIKAHLIERGVAPGKIVSIPTGIDMAGFETAVPGSLRADLGIPAGAPLVGQVAVLRGGKGPESFVKAAQLAIAQGCPAWFVLVGDGPARATVERLLAGNNPDGRIKLAGFRRDVPAVLADLDLFVLAAHAPEGVPQAILQAHAARRPVISTDRGGIDEVAIPDRTALVVPHRNPEALATAMQDLLAHPERGRQLAAAGHALVREHYTLDHMLDKLEALYRGLQTPF